MHNKLDTTPEKEQFSEKFLRIVRNFSEKEKKSLAEAKATLLSYKMIYLKEPQQAKSIGSPKKQSESSRNF